VGRTPWNWWTSYCGSLQWPPGSCFSRYHLFKKRVSVSFWQNVLHNQTHWRWHFVIWETRGLDRKFPESFL
jgi:hypothetical protein